MIGEAKLTYPNNDLAQLVRKDLVDKFGNRELACYNLYLPGVITPKAKVTSFPDPDVKITSVEDQIKAMGLPSKPIIPRSEGTITHLNSVGGDNVSFTFDRDANKVLFAGGPVEFGVPEGTVLKPAHWLALEIGFPLGWEGVEYQTIPYTLNGVPNFVVLTAENIESKKFTLYFDAAMTTNELSINWSEDYQAERIHVVIDSSLQDSAIKKIPALPTQPIVSFSYPSSDIYSEAIIQIDVDLELGRQ